jgi:hypothetical protein
MTVMTAIAVAATGMTTTILPAAAQQQSFIHITKDGTTSYTLSGGSSNVGSFDTTYRIAGEASAIMSAENLTKSTIIEDFISSPTIGYVMVSNTTSASSNSSSSSAGATLPNPFASPEQITERVTNELGRVITEAGSNTSQGQQVEIKCNFGISLDDMHCNYLSLPPMGQG